MTDTTQRSPSETAKFLSGMTDDQGRLAPMGSVRLDEDGRLTRREGSDGIDFQFTYMGYQFAVRAEISPGHTRLRIHAMLGHLPFTAESPYLRANVRAVVTCAGAALGGRIQLSRTQQIMLLDEFHFDESLTPSTLLSNTVRFLLAAKPYLELLQFLGGVSEAAKKALPKGPAARKGSAAQASPA